MFILQGNENFLQASKNGDLLTVTHLISTQIINLKCSNTQSQTVLILAYKNGHHPIFQLLIASKNYIDVKGAHYWTAVLWACYQGHPRAVTDLMNNQANIHIKYPRSGLSPILISAAREQHELVDVLITQEANFETRCLSLSFTPLSWASWNGHHKVVKVLLDHGASIERKDYVHGRCPLFLAFMPVHVWLKSSPRHLSSVKRLRTCDIEPGLCVVAATGGYSKQDMLEYQRPPRTMMLGPFFQPLRSD